MLSRISKTFALDSKNFLIITNTLDFTPQSSYLSASRLLTTNQS